MGSPPPPPPGFPAELIAMLAYFAWKASEGLIDSHKAQLGHLYDGDQVQAFYLAKGEQWATAAPSKAHFALGPFAMSQDTATIITRGKVQADGSITIGSKAYTVYAIAEHGQLIARAVEV